MISVQSASANVWPPQYSSHSYPQPLSFLDKNFVTHQKTRKKNNIHINETTKSEKREPNRNKRTTNGKLAIFEGDIGLSEFSATIFICFLHLYALYGHTHPHTHTRTHTFAILFFMFGLHNQDYHMFFSMFTERRMLFITNWMKVLSWSHYESIYCHSPSERPTHENPRHSVERATDTIDDGKCEMEKYYFYRLNARYRLHARGLYDLTIDLVGSFSCLCCTRGRAAARKKNGQSRKFYIDMAQSSPPCRPGRSTMLPNV